MHFFELIKKIQKLGISRGTHKNTVINRLMFVNDFKSAKMISKMDDVFYNDFIRYSIENPPLQ